MLFCVWKCKFAGVIASMMTMIMLIMMIICQICNTCVSPLPHFISILLLYFVCWLYFILLLSCYLGFLPQQDTSCPQSKFVRGLRNQEKIQKESVRNSERLRDTFQATRNNFSLFWLNLNVFMASRLSLL